MKVTIETRMPRTGNVTHSTYLDGEAGAEAFRILSQPWGSEERDTLYGPHQYGVPEWTEAV